MSIRSQKKANRISEGRDRGELGAAFLPFRKETGFFGQSRHWSRKYWRARQSALFGESHAAKRPGIAELLRRSGALYRREAARGASWMKLCDSDVGEHGAIGTCAELAVSGEDYDAAQAARRQLASMFRAVSTTSE